MNPNTSSPPALVMVTGTPWTWTPLMLIVCTACVVEVSCCGVFSDIIPPAGAIFARVRSFRPPAAVLLEPAGGEVVTTEAVGVVVVGETESWIWSDCHSPEAVLKRI